MISRRYRNGATADGCSVTVDALLTALRNDDFTALGMSETVADRFKEAMTKARLRKLTAIRCSDRYALDMRMPDDPTVWRGLEDLSGGQRIAVLLSLLLETNDDRPLVIDQPEDELDNRFLWDTILPALRRLKGRRQVVVATHDANIVVNGDADQVVLLRASAYHGRVKLEGAIDDPVVRDAIANTVDGGQDAFRLRRLKYGF